MGKGFDTQRYKTKLKDPYMDKNIYRDPTICPGCGVIFHEKRWIMSQSLKEELTKTGKEFYKKLCPACRKIKDRYPLGVVEIRTDYISLKSNEIKNHIENLVQRENHRSPLERIINYTNTEKKIYIETTTEHLAKKIGRGVSKTFGGQMNVSFSSDQKFIRVQVEEE